MRSRSLALLLLLAACQQAEPPAPEPTATPSPPEPLTSLKGDYRVTDVDAVGFDPVNAVILHVSDDRIDFVNCQRIGWAYTFADGKVTTERSPPPGEPCPDKMEVRMLQMVSAIDATEQAARQPDGTVKLAGDLRSVTLDPQ